MIKTVIKRDGRVAPFDPAKIIAAVTSAMKRTEKGADEALAAKVAEAIEGSAAEQMSVEDIQDKVEMALMKSSRKDAAKAYIAYRDRRTVARKAKTKNVFLEIIEAKNNDITRENANMNADTPAGMMMKFASETTKPFVSDYLLSEDVNNALKNNYIHIHDRDYYPTRSVTCLTGDTHISLMTGDGQAKVVEMSYLDRFFKADEYGAVAEIAEEIYIKGRSRWTKLLNVCRRICNNNDALYLITLSSGDSIKATAEHKIPVFDAATGQEKLKFVEDINAGDFMIKVTSDFKKQKNIAIVSKTEISHDGVVVYDIETAEHWFEANGYIVHNCVQHPLDRVLQEGFRAGHGESRPAKRIETAATLACISLETAQNEMHGGQAIPAFDFYLAPYVRKTYVEEVEKLEKIFGNLDDLKVIEFTDYIKRDIDRQRLSHSELAQHCVNNTVDRVHQAMEAFIHNMNTIHSRGGNQVVFSSINYGTDTSAEGRCVIRELLNSTYEGVGDGATAIFPIQIWKKKRGVSYLPSDPNYDLYMLACKVTGKRFFPNFLNLDAPFNADEDWRADDPLRYKHEVATMGCRTRVFENRYGEKTSIGRGNLSFTTVNIVRLAIEAKGDVEGFFKSLEETLDLTALQLHERFEFQKTAFAKQFPFLMSKLWAGGDELGPDERVESVINQGTLGIGFIGLAECLVALIGAHHGESEEAQRLGLRIVTFFRDKALGYCDKYGHNYSVLATPAEGLSGKFTKKDRKDFGIIEGVTDKDYYTNSNHVPVYYKCSPVAKAKIEAPYHDLTRGGHIFYIEADGDAAKNPEAIAAFVDIMDKYGIGYGSVNHHRNRCLDCGHEDSEKDETVCPACGGERIDTLQRITGYLVGTTDRWNSGKLAELKDRVTHTDAYGD